jgi:hypothetical protein
MTEPTNEVEEIRDFTLPMKPHRFKIDVDVFAAPAILSPVTLQRVARLHADMGSRGVDTSSPEAIERTMVLIGDMFKILLPGPSGKRFAARLQADGSEPDLKVMADAYDTDSASTAELIAKGAIPENEIVYLQPIDLTRQALPALYWLLEQYGLRPTRQSSPLLSDSGTGDLTDGVLATEPTGEPSAVPLSF